MDLYAVIGFPIQHSLSPYIHQHFAKITHTELKYTAIEATPEEFLNKAREFLYYGKGLNVTAPYKQNALDLADEINPAAQLAQAANTLIKIDHHIIADNTDGIGLVRDLKLNQHLELKNKQLLILGAGGAARGILQALVNENPATISIANRSIEKARKLALNFEIEFLALAELANRSFDLIIHASTSLPELPQNFLAQQALCYDLNYVETAKSFRQWAKQQQATYINGVGMLVEQAAEAFYLWKGVRPKTSEILSELRHMSIF